MQEILINQINQGGMADSKYEGEANSVSKIVGIDLHSEPGLLKANYKLKKDSGSTIDEFCKCIVTSSNGNVYFFSSESGKIWMKDTAGVYSLKYTTVPSAGGSAILGATEYRGELFWATSDYVFKVSVDSADWGTLKTPWAESTSYSTNDEVYYEAKNYKCISGHTSSNWTDVKAWFFDGEFESGDEVKYWGTPYKALATHTADQYNTPGRDAPDAWENEKYFARDKVISHGSNHYACLLSHRSFDGSEPGTGEDWTVFWKEVDKWTDFWQEMEDNVPGEGKDWEDYWEVIDDGYAVQWKEFQTKDPDFHPMAIARNGLYVGDGDVLAQIKPPLGDDDDDDVVFTPEALEIVKEHRIKSLSAIDIQLAIGTYVDNNVNKTTIYRWDTWTYTWNMEDEIDEVGINAFIPVDNYFFVQAGNTGSIYSYDYNMLYLTKRIPGDWDGQKSSRVQPNATDFFKQRPLFGVSKEEGSTASGATPGIYSLATMNPRVYHRVLAIEYVTSTYSDDTIIGAIEVKGDQLYISWKDGDETGIDIIDYENRYNNAYLESRVIYLDRKSAHPYTDFSIGYTDVPEDCGIKAYIKQNYADTWAEIVLTQDEIRKKFYSDLRLESNVVEFKLELISDGVNTPCVDYISLTGEEHHGRGF